MRKSEQGKDKLLDVIEKSSHLGNFFLNKYLGTD
jgi:hypothetical protein